MSSDVMQHRIAAGGIVISGSHGGAYAGYLAARSGARAVILNDAGVGLDEAGLGALALCERIGMAAATVAHNSARIGDAESARTAGVISFSNAAAAAAGVRPGMRCADAARRLTVAAEPAVPSRRPSRTRNWPQAGVPESVCCNAKLESVNMHAAH